MNHEELRRCVDDYVDGVLDEALKATFEEAMVDFEALRVEVEAARELKRQANALPQVILPERDLWPEIQARIERPKAIIDFSRFRGRRPRYAVLRYVLAAAALVLLAVGVGVLYGYEGRVEPSVPELMAVDPELGRIEQQYSEATQELMNAFDARRALLPEVTLGVVEENLAIIEAAVTEINLALVNDPDSPELEHMLHAAYRNEVDLLQQAIQLADES